MFESYIKGAFHKYAMRLQAIRAELVHIQAILEPAAKFDAAKTVCDVADLERDKNLALVAESVRGVCSILVRVLDSLKVSHN